MEKITYGSTIKEIKDCQDCPFVKDSHGGGDTTNYHCGITGNLVGGQIEWRSEMLPVPKNCPCRIKKEKPIDPFKEFLKKAEIKVQELDPNKVYNLTLTFEDFDDLNRTMEYIKDIPKKFKEEFNVWVAILLQVKSQGIIYNLTEVDQLVPVTQQVAMEKVINDFAERLIGLYEPEPDEKGISWSTPCEVIIQNIKDIRDEVLEELKGKGN